MTLSLDVKMKIKGHFSLTAINADTGEERFLTDFDNLVVNQGLDFIATGSPSSSVVFYGCVVGTGTSTPSPTDTLLQTFLAGTQNNLSTTNAYSGSPAWTSTSTQTYQFGVGVAAGNLTEIGICGT